MTTRTTTHGATRAATTEANMYHVIPSSRQTTEADVLDYAGDGNEYEALDEACAAAASLDETCPIESEVCAACGWRSSDGDCSGDEGDAPSCPRCGAESIVQGGYWQVVVREHGGLRLVPEDIRTGDRVETVGLIAQEHDTGIVDRVEGDVAVVAWDSGVTGPCETRRLHVVERAVQS